jgi:hypothetical protein
MLNTFLSFGIILREAAVSNAVSSFKTSIQPDVCDLYATQFSEHPVLYPALISL